MRRSSGIRRVVLVVMDGLRAEAVRRLDLPVLSGLARSGAWTFSANTIRPSVTAAAMTSLITGVSPDEHGIGARGFGIPRNLPRLQPITQVLRKSSIPSCAFFSDIPFTYRWLARRLASIAGVESVHFRGDDSTRIVALAEAEIRSTPEGLVFMHWPEADQAGHAFGWRSEEYEAKAREMDVALGRLCEMLDLEGGHTVLMVCADHGGGGACATDHDSTHPDDVTIPIVLAGAGVGKVHLGPGVSLLDLPPTVLWCLGAQIPANYCGMPLVQAFQRKAQAA
jgi:predicted AlkP superfamily pyrophosphatase or phosphodiesterase